MSSKIMNNKRCERNKETAIRVLARAKAVIFDVDDTLVSSFEANLIKHQMTARAMGLKPPTREQYARLYGSLGLRDIIVAMYGRGVNIRLYKQRAHEEFTNYSDFRSLGKIKKLFEQLKEKGKKVGTITNSDRIPTRLKLENLGISMDESCKSRLIDSFQCADNTKVRKPNPQCFDEILQTLQMTKEEIIFIADSLHDFEAAKEGGVPFFAVLTGLTSREDFIQVGLEETFIFDNVDCISSLLAYL